MLIRIPPWTAFSCKILIVLLLYFNVDPSIPVKNSNCIPIEVYEPNFSDASKLFYAVCYRCWWWQDNDFMDFGPWCILGTKIFRIIWCNRYELGNRSSVSDVDTSASSSLSPSAFLILLLLSSFSSSTVLLLRSFSFFFWFCLDS